MPTYEATQKGYAKLWGSIAVKSGKDDTNATYFAKLIIKGESKYREVEAATGWPWFFVGAIHMRESGCDFKGVLHNGEKIIGTQRKTKLVPKGRGPFKTWAAAAIDAIQMKIGLYAGRVWCPALMGYVSEGFNGWGYTGKGVNSPYDWAGSNHEQTGKYVADHVWDKNFDDPQIGTMTVLKRLSELRPDVAEALAENHKTPSAIFTKKNATIAGGVATVGGGAAATTEPSSWLDQFSGVISVLQNYGTTIAAVFTVALVVGVVGFHFYEKYTAHVEASS
jgi:lysozyme family protein